MKSQKLELNPDHLDALNVTLNWFGGSINRLDLFVASIESCIMKDLKDMDLVRGGFFGWQITHLGRKALKENNINILHDTRG